VLIGQTAIVSNPEAIVAYTLRTHLCVGRYRALARQRCGQPSNWRRRWDREQPRNQYCGCRPNQCQSVSVRSNALSFEQRRSSDEEGMSRVSPGLPSTLSLSALLILGCAAKPPHLVDAPAASQGKTSYAYIFDPAKPANDLPADVQFIRPHPAGVTALPRYPGRALIAHDGPHREDVRIVIDAQGTVSSVSDSPLAQSDGGPYADDYRRAVKEAVQTWQYAPGLLQHVQNGPDHDNDGKPDYKVASSSDPIAVFYDIRFTFKIVEGKGVVSQN
jgi:hypothetical protein